MRRSLAAPIALALALAACASEPPAQPAAPARPAAALDVLRVIREEVAPGVLDTTWFASYSRQSEFRSSRP